MQVRAIGLVGLGMAVAAAAWLRTTRFIETSTETVYVFPALFFFCVALAALLGRGIARRRARAQAMSSLDKYSDNTRETYRIEYPADQRPTLKAEVGRPGSSTACSFQVLDVSEEGVRLVNGGKLKPGDMLWGKLKFASGNTAAVAGRAVWVQGKEVGVHLSQIVPPAIIMDEQFRLQPYLRHKPEVANP